VAIVEDQPHGILSDRFDCRDIDIFLAGDQLHGAAMPTHLGGWRKTAQVLEGQGKGLAVGKADFQDS